MTENEEKIKKKSVRGAFSYLIRTLLLNLISISALLYLSSALEPAEFGIFGIVTQFVGLLIFISDIGLAAALVQKKNEPSRQDFVTTFTIQQLLSWLIVFIALAVIWSGYLAVKTGVVGNWILLALAISFPLASFKTIPSILLERKLEYEKLVIPQIIETIVYNAVLVYLVWKGFGVLSFAYAVIFRSVAGLLVMYIIQPWRPGLAIYWKSLSLFKFGLAFQANDILARIKDQFYFLALGYYFPLQTFGYIQWAKNWSMYPYNLTVQNVMAITFPTFARLQDNPTLLRKALEKTLYFVALVTFPLLAGMVLFFIPLTKLHLEYQKWLPAVVSLALFSFSVAWSAISTPMMNALAAMGKMTIVLTLMSFWTVATWVLTPILIWQFDYVGVALTAVLIGFSSLVPVWFMQKIVSFSFWNMIWRQIVATGVMIAVGWWSLTFWSTSYLWFISGIFVVGGAYLLTLLALDYKMLFKQISSVLRVATS